VRAAQTLHELTGNEGWSSHVVAVLQLPNFWTVHMDAARALATFAPTRELIAAVAQGMTNEDYLVRYHSANTMLGYCGRPADVYAVPDLFDRISEDSKPKLWSAAAAELAAEALIKLH
jgi:phytoene/squalene synthetase